MTHPAGTFICIYSSWLTCHSPSSNVSIQCTIIYRIIDSRAPQGLPCQVTSQPLQVFSRGRSVLPTRLFVPSDAASPANLSPVVPGISAPWGHPEHTCPPATGQPFRCVPTGMSPSPLLQTNTEAATSPAPALHSDFSRPLSIPGTCHSVDCSLSTSPRKHVPRTTCSAWSDNQDSKGQGCQLFVPGSR